MTAAVYAEDLTDILVDFASTTGWTAIGTGGAGLNAPETDYFIQGSNSITKNAFASSTKGMIYDSGSDQGGSGTDGAYFIWLTHTAPNSLDTRAGGGMRFIIGSSTSAYNEYYVGGSDIQEFQGWRLVAIKEQNASWNAQTGTPSTTSEQTFGALWDLPSGGPTKGAPNGIDAFRFGRGTVTITNGTAPDAAATFDGVITSLEDAGTGAGNRYGLVTQREAGGAFENSGRIQFGTSGTQVRFTDSDKFIFVRWHPHVTDGFHAWEVNNASTVLTLTNIAVQVLQNPDGHTTSRTSFTVNNNATVSLAGCSFINMSTFSFGTNTTADSCTFLRCDQITHAGATMNNSTVASHRTPITTAQDETSYDSSPATEGSFSGGTSGYAVSDTILMQDGTIVTVDAVSAGVVTQFTINSTGATHSVAGSTIAEERNSGAGSGDFSLTPGVDNYPESASVLYNLAADPDGEMDGMTFEQGTNVVHAIDFGTLVTADITLRDCAFNGFDSTADSKGATFRFLATTGSLNLNLVNCTVDGNPATTANIGVDDAAGISVTVVVDPVTTKVTTIDEDGNAIASARVFLETADSGGGSGFPFEAGVSTLTQAAGTATLTASAAHGLSTGDYVVIRGAGIEGYNKTAQITVTSTTQFTYTVASGLGSPAGGTPIFSYCPISGTTSSLGVIQSSKTWPAAQGLKGWARKSTSSPYYRQSTLTVSDASGGSDITALMILDE